MSRSILQKLFWNPNYFTIAIRRKGSREDGLFQNRTFIAETELCSKQDYWVADPMLAEENGKTWLFYEACYRGKGRIEVVQILDNGQVGEPQTVLEKEYHLSYPFVFKEGDIWYMIPESSACNKVQLYRATEFPISWELDQVLLEGRGVDTTVHRIGGRYLMVTFIPEDGSEAVTPRAYWMVFHGGRSELTELSWSEYDPLRSRGAGGFFETRGRLYRPAQINRTDSYGDGVVFKEVTVTETEYSERDVCDINASAVQFGAYPFDGLHTYSATDRFEVIDVRCAFLDLLKPCKKLGSVLVKK